MLKKKARLILALDVDSAEKAEHLVNRLYPEIKLFKVGPQLFIACGPQIIKFINRKAAGVFLDLKFNDIPNTVAQAVRQATRLRVKMVTLHICGGQEMLKAAVAAARQESRRLRIRAPLLIGVTVLTSQKSGPDKVMDLARLGLSCGLDGVVCSAREAGLLKSKIKTRFVAVTPGIRLERSGKDDQKRTATPQEAVKAGSDFLVVGRPVLEAEDPVSAARKILNLSR